MTQEKFEEIEAKVAELFVNDISPRESTIKLEEEFGSKDTHEAMTKILKDKFGYTEDSLKEEEKEKSMTREKIDELKEYAMDMLEKNTVDGALFTSLEELTASCCCDAEDTPMYAFTLSGKNKTHAEFKTAASIDDIKEYLIEQGDASMEAIVFKRESTLSIDTPVTETKFND